MLGWLLLGLLFGLGAAANRKDFTGYKVIRVPIANEEQAKILQDLSRLEVDFWTLPTTTTPAELLTPPGVFKNVSGILQTLKLPFTVEIDNLEESIVEEREANNYAKRQHTSFFRSGAGDFEGIHSYYGTFEQIQDWLRRVASTYSSIASLESIGRTHEGRDLTVLKLSNGGSNKRVIWIDGGIHAREWIAPSTTLYTAWKLISGYQSGETRAFLDKFDWYFLPVVNPDGYVHTHDMNRMWRKNRRPNNHRDCYGVDPNRNFGFHWAERGTMSSSDPCSEIYHGPYAASEYEPYFMQQALQKFKGRLQVYLSFHCYAQMWFVPYGYTWQAAPDHDESLRVANLARDAVYAVNKKWYQTGTPSELMYAAGGGSYDYAKGVVGAKYAFTIELRPTQQESRNGFILHPSYIRPTGDEIWAGVRKMVEVMRLIY
ncbi:carboxypeptidase B-like [Lineus longissimus]|uniref:carboxypeptidase B-like n=1 Tax=Lineus longissimus TaxID=88925 RepID=UPI002B4E4851